MNSEMLGKVRHQHFVISISKMLNQYFFRCGAMAFMVFLLLSVAVFAETVLTESDCGKTVRLKPQEEAIVTLPSNPTTGYGWEMVDQGVDAAVVVVSKVFRTSTGASGRVGAGGLEHFRLRLRNAGRFTVTFVYRRSWEKEKEPERIFRITLEEQ
ncbi:MAG: protease inhibitor I42 family protein [Syntrophales bacterium]|nr:protease inhibitor I42 family protein [Syntrophales bacterium]